MHAPVSSATYEIAGAGVPAGRTLPVLRHTTSRREFNTFDARLPAAMLEVEDLTYHHDSAVTLPCLPWRDEPCAEDHRRDPRIMEELKPYHPEVYRAFHELTCQVDSEELTAGRRSLVLLACTYHFLEKNPSYELLLAGHTDTSGRDSYNFDLSDLRAENVHCLLTGSRARWVAIARLKSKVEDYQTICRHYAEVDGWPCDPGPIDNIAGPGTKAALEAFQRTYNSTFHKSIAEDGVIGPQTWGAIFDVYMNELARLLEVGVDGLDPFRSQLRYVDCNHPWIGCGERIPVDAPRLDDYRSRENRRVEILFFPDSARPNLAAHLAGGVIRSGSGRRAQSSVYRQGAYRWVLVRPVWWDAEPPRSSYEPRFEMNEVSEDTETLFDKPGGEEYGIAEPPVAASEDPNDPFSPFASYETYHQPFGSELTRLRRAERERGRAHGRA